MTSGAIIFREGTATLEQILGHLRACDSRFLPQLSARLDLAAYARKIAIHAVTFEAWDGDTLVGLAAGYMNDLERRHGHVTTSSVLAPYEGRGIAAALMRMCVDAARARGMAVMTLEVWEDHGRSIAYCNRIGFRESARRGPTIVMSLAL